MIYTDKLLSSLGHDESVLYILAGLVVFASATSDLTLLELGSNVMSEKNTDIYVNTSPQV